MELTLTLLAPLLTVRQRRHIGAAMVSTLMIGCSKDQVVPTVPEYQQAEEAASLTANAPLVVLPLHTYDGSGESVHPDFLAPPAEFITGLQYLVVTPYPGGTTKFENPSLYAGTDGYNWGASPGAPMPLAKPLAGYLSDPDIVYSPVTNELVLYYRQASKDDRIFMIRSHDGVVWSKPVLLITTAFSKTLSPAVVRKEHGDWYMWSVDGAPGCKGASTSVSVRRSMNGTTWSDPSPVNIPLLPGQFVWHIDAQWIPSFGEFWAIFPVKTAGTCATQAIYIATSKDGVSWTTNPTPVLTTGAIPEFRDVVYRSTFGYDPRTDEVTFWFSGARKNGKNIVWRTAVQKRSRIDLFRQVAADGVAPIPVAKSDVRSTFDPP